MKLSPHEGRDVAQTSVRITAAGDGLSDALAIDPAEYHIGDRVHIVLETTVARVAHEPIRDTDVLRRVHTLRTDLGTVVDEAQVGALLEAQRIAIEERKGIMRLPDGDDPDA